MTTRQNIPRWTRPYARAFISGGPTRVCDEEPPEGWEPMPFLGFGCSVNGETEEESDD